MRTKFTALAVAAALMLVGAQVANSASSNTYDGLAQRIDIAVSNLVPASRFACVNSNATPGARKPIRVVLNSRRYLDRARQAVAAKKGMKLTKFIVLKRPYSLAGQYDIALTIEHAYRPFGNEHDYSVRAGVESTSNDSSACQKVVIVLKSYQGHPITAETRVWANQQVARYGSDRVRIEEQSSSDPDRRNEVVPQ